MAIDVQYRGDNDDSGPSDGVWFDVDLQDHPKKMVHVYEDFTGISDLALVGTTELITDLVGGGVNIKASSDAVDSRFAFKLADNKDLTFEARVKPVSAAAFNCGLQDTGGTSRITFEVAANSAVLHHDNAVADDIIATQAIDAATWVKLGFRVRGSGDDTEFTGYADGVKIASAKLGDMTAAAVASTIMKVSIVSSDTPDIAVDWVRVAQLR
tara:strand:+ start:1832 stop:2467 length:636 start_codon:yes stop_codon:yes gene_type:complete